MRSRSRPLLRQAIPMLNALAFSPQSFVQSGTGAAFDGSKFQQTTWLWRKWKVLATRRSLYIDRAIARSADIHLKTPVYSREPDMRASFQTDRYVFVDTRVPGQARKPIWTTRWSSSSRQPSKRRNKGSMHNVVSSFKDYKLSRCFPFSRRCLATWRPTR